MSFYSIYFFVFFAVLFLLYYSLPSKIRPYLLFISGCIFAYSFSPRTLAILILTVFVFYYLSFRKPQFAVTIGILYSIILLILFKYLNFLSINVDFLINAIGWNYSPELLKFIIPAGLSFYLFQSISYLIEIKRGNIKPETDFLVYANYTMFFSKLMSGPIERPNDLLIQFKKITIFDYQLVTDGMKIAAWGFFKKLVIADRLSFIVNNVYSDSDAGGVNLVVASFLYSVQIYADFSGYTDIALGISRMLGFRLTDNFNLPYFARSVSDFWKRWHITLSFWVRDYIFLPVAYASARARKVYSFLRMKPDSYAYIVSAMLSMLVIGIWHGAGWTFIVWGLIHGLYLVAGYILRKPRKKLRRVLHMKHNSGFLAIVQVTITFVLVTFAWIFFRAESLSQAFSIISGMKSFFPDLMNAAGNIYKLKILFTFFGVSFREFTIGIISVLILFTVDFFRAKTNIIDWLRNRSLIVRWIIYYALVLTIIFFGAFNTSQDFIYMQF